MKKLCIAVIAVAFLSGCKENKKAEEPASTETVEIVDMHTSQIALDWQGRYSGVLPCADCEGIETILDLHDNATYTLHSTYLGKENGHFMGKGRFVWSDDGSTVILQDTEKTMYKVGENTLTRLDVEGNVITGDLAEFYVLKKE